MQISTPADLAAATENAPDALTLAELNKLEAAGIELTRPEKRLQTRLKETSEAAANAAERRQQLADIEAAKQEAREAHEKARTIHSSAAPTAPDDHLVLGKAADFVTTTGYPLHTWELDDGRCYVFREHALLHFVPKAIALEIVSKHGARRLPGTSWDRVPKNLLRAIVNTGAWTEHRGSQTLRGRDAAGNLQVTVDGDGTNWEAVLRVASAAVRGCDSLPLLRTWLTATATSGEEGYEGYGAFATLLSKRIAELGGDEVEEEQQDEELDDADAEVEEEELAEAEEVDPAEESPGETPAAATDDAGPLKAD